MSGLFDIPLVRSARLAAALASGRRLPFSVTFILTNRCNYRCGYCDIPGQESEELSTAEIRGAIDELVVAGMARASFSGGEPLLRPDAVELIRHAHGHGLFTSLNTNGWLTCERLPELACALDMIMVSLDGPAEIHDRVRGRRGAHERAVQSLVRARELGIATSSIAVLGPWNFDHLDEILEQGRRLGTWTYVQPAYETCFGPTERLHPMFDAEKLRALADRLEEFRRRGYPIGASSGFLARLRRGPRFSDCARCAAGRYFASVLPDGRMVPCHQTSGAASASGRDDGYVAAFRRLARPVGGEGCAISPYQESDLIFSLHPGAIGAALRRSRVR